MANLNAQPATLVARIAIQTNLAIPAAWHLFSILALLYVPLAQRTAFPAVILKHALHVNRSMQFQRVCVSPAKVVSILIQMIYVRIALTAIFSKMVSALNAYQIVYLAINFLVLFNIYMDIF